MNTSLELADFVHPVHTITIAHKDAIRAFLYDLCLQLNVQDAQGLSAQLMLLYDGAIVTAVMRHDASAANDARAAAKTLLGAAHSIWE